MSDNERERRRKAGAVPWLSSAADKGVVDLAAGGSGRAASFLHRLLAPLGGFGETLASGLSSPLALGLLIGMTAVGGGYGLVTIWQKASSDGASGGRTARFRLPSSDIAAPGRTSAKPYSGTMGSLEMFAKTNRGAMDDGAKKDEGEPAASEEKDSAAAAPAVDTEQLAAAAAAEAGSASLGAGARARLAPMESLGGKSGGVSGSALFAGLPGSAGGSGVSGGTGGGAGSGGSGGGRLSSSRVQSRPVLGRSGQSTRGNARNALGQLRNASAFSRQGAATGSDTGAKFLTDKAFDGTTGAGGSPIGGAGLSQGAGGLSPGAGNVPPSSGGPTGTSGPGDTGGGTTSCTGPNCSTSGPQEPRSGVNVNPLQWLVDNKIKMLIAAAGMLAVAFALKFTKVQFLMSLGKFFAYGAAIAFAGVAAAGALLAAAGDYLTGGIFTVVGATGMIMAMKLAKSIGNAQKELKKEDIIDDLEDEAKKVGKRLNDPDLTPGRRAALEKRLSEIRAELGLNPDGTSSSGQGSAGSSAANDSAGGTGGTQNSGAASGSGAGAGGTNYTPQDIDAMRSGLAEARRTGSSTATVNWPQGPGGTGGNQSSISVDELTRLLGENQPPQAPPLPDPTVEFPSAPEIGDKVYDSAGRRWVYNGQGWHIRG